MAVTGEKYTTALRQVNAAQAVQDASQVPSGARPYLAAVLESLRNQGWPCHADPVLADGSYIAFGGPPAGLRIAVSRSGSAEGADPDDHQAAHPDGPLSLEAACLASREAAAEDLNWRADGAQPPAVAAGQLDAALARTRLARVRKLEADSTVPCPICGDRYPAHHLLSNSPGADAACPACIFDGDQQEVTDLPHLASEIDELTRSDLAAPAGWDAVAAVLALCCGRNLGPRADRELAMSGFYPQLTARWRDPMQRSWIWLPPRRHRHDAFAHLGAGATIQALADALDRHKPDIRATAKSVCRDDGARWRDSVWNSAVAYAVAFTTQARERPRHRKPVHVVDSTSDGLSLIAAPFQVSGDPLNVEGGLHALLEYLLFPLLLGHGLRDEPREPGRQYGAEPGDPRPPRRRTDAHVTHSIDRSVQVANILGKNPFTRIPGIWDGPPATDPGQSPLSAARPASEPVTELRDELRTLLACELYDRDGAMHVSAGDAWSRLGWWIPADDAAQALRQARDYLTGLSELEMLWAGGPDGRWRKPRWIEASVEQVPAPGDGGDPALAIRYDGGQLATALVREIVAARGPRALTVAELLGAAARQPAGPGDESTPSSPGHSQDEAAAGLRRAGREHLQMVAQSCGEEYDTSWAWNSFGLWIPPEDPAAADQQMQQVFGNCSPERPATVEILWRHRGDAAPAWYRVRIMETRPSRRRPALLGLWANPATGLMELGDVVAVRPSIDGLPLSCTGTASPEFRPSAWRPAADPEDLVPEVMMTQAEAELMISRYLHYQSHQLGPLWTTVDAQAAATRDRLMDIVTAAGAAGSRTDINVAVEVIDMSVGCQAHVFDPPPAYTDVDESRRVGLHEVAHAHLDGTVGLEEHGRGHLDAVLTCLALYGGSLHLATVPLDGTTTATESLYRVHYDWRCEFVGNARQTAGRPATSAL